MLCKTVSLWITINLLYILNNFLYSADWHGRCWVPAVCRHRREILVSSASLGASSLDWAALALVATGTAAVYRALALIQTCHLCCCCHQPWTQIGRELPRNQSSRILCCYTQHRLHLILNLLSLQLECESPCVWAVSRVSPVAVWRSESAWAQLHSYSAALHTWGQCPPVSGRTETINTATQAATHLPSPPPPHLQPCTWHLSCLYQLCMNSEQHKGGYPTPSESTICSLSWLTHNYFAGNIAFGWPIEPFFVNLTQMQNYNDKGKMSMGQVWAA